MDRVIILIVFVIGILISCNGPGETVEKAWPCTESPDSATCAYLNRVDSIATAQHSLRENLKSAGWFSFIYPMQGPKMSIQIPTELSYRYYGVIDVPGAYNGPRFATRIDDDWLEGLSPCYDGGGYLNLEYPSFGCEYIGTSGIGDYVPILSEYYDTLALVQEIHQTNEFFNTTDYYNLYQRQEDSTSFKLFYQIYFDAYYQELAQKIAYSFYPTPEE